MTKKAWKDAAARAQAGHAFKREILGQRQWKSDLDIVKNDSDNLNLKTNNSIQRNTNHTGGFQRLRDFRWIRCIITIYGA